MKITRLLVLGLALILVSLLGGCGESEKTEEVKQIKVGLIFLDSANNSYGEGYYSYEALKELEAKYGIYIAYNESVILGNSFGVLSSYGQDGFDLVIALGSMYEEPIKSVAPSYPDTTFICINGTTNTENIFSFDLREEDLAFVAGVFASSISSSETLGYIEEKDSLPMFEDFKLGALSIKANQNFEQRTLEPYIDEFEEVAQDFQNKKVTVVATSFNSVKLESKLQEKGLGQVVLNGYQGSEPERPLVSGRIVVDYKVVYDTIFQQFKNKGLGKDSPVLGFNNESIVFQNLDSLPESVRANVEQAITAKKNNK